MNVLIPLSYLSSSSTFYKRIYGLSPVCLSPDKDFLVKGLGLETIAFMDFAILTLLIYLSKKYFSRSLNGVANNITMPHLI